ncbi:MAG: hypothetical protein ACLR7D_02605 [Lachnospira eligens]
MFEYNTVEEAVKDLQDGKLILVSDDESRENRATLYVPLNLQLLKM